MKQVKSEFGRLMVEMLGVLALIGVLSSAGVMGYLYGMNRYKASVLSAEANLRAVIVSGQIGFDNQLPSIDEFTIKDFGYGVFDGKVYGEDGSSLWTETDKKFSLKIESVSKSVCQSLQNTIGGVIQGFSPLECEDNATVILTYNNDFSTNEIASLEADCSVYNGTSSNNTGGTAGLAADGVTPCKCPVRQKWNVDGQACEDTNECTSYTAQECKEGYYCSFDNSATCSDDCTSAGGGTCTAGVGTCTPLTGGTEVTTKKDGYSGLLTGAAMNWWTANSWCIAHGLQIPSLSEFGCTPDDTKDSGWDCDWTKFKVNGLLHKSNWWVSDAPDCRSRNLNVPNSTVDLDTPRKERWYSTLCTTGKQEEEVFAGAGEACDTTTDCSTGLFCNAEKKCQTKLDDGTVCPSSDACKSGYCGKNGSDTNVCFTSCTSYTTKECGEGYYCAFNYPEKCSERGVGACIPVIDGVELTEKNDGVDGLFISNKMNWWSANSLCVAHGRHMASLEEMGCHADPNRNCDDWNRFYRGALSGLSWWVSDLYTSCVGYNITTNHSPSVDHDTHLDNKIYYSIICK